MVRVTTYFKFEHYLIAVRKKLTSISSSVAHTVAGFAKRRQAKMHSTVSVLVLYSAGDELDGLW